MRKPIFAFEKYSTKLSIFGLVLLFCGSLCGLTAAVFNAKPHQALANEVSWAPEEEEDRIEREELTVNITSSALTDTSQSVSTLFRSQKVDVANNSPRVQNVFIAPDDPEFTTFDEMVDKCKADQTAAQEAGETYVLPKYNATIYNIQYRSNATMANTIVIPELVSYRSVFYLNITSISSNVVFDQKSGDVNYGGIERIVIPKSVTSIAEDAFVEVPENVEFFVEASETYIIEAESEEEEPIEAKTYPEAWTSSDKITYDYELTEAESKLLNVQSSNYSSLGSGSDFFLGVYEDNYYFPLYMEYTLEKKVGDEWQLEAEPKYIQVPLSSSNTNYDAVGSVMGVDYITPFIEVDIPADSRVNLDSVVFHNIYRSIPEYDEHNSTTGRMVPDIQTGPCYAVPAVGSFVIPYFSDLYDVTPKSCSTFGDFLHFDVTLSRLLLDGYGMYPSLNATLFAQNKAAIDNKTVQIRYQFSALDRASYRFTFVENGQTSEVTVRVSTPISYVLTNAGDTTFGFLVEQTKLEGHSLASMTKVELCGFVVKMDLYKPDTNSIITKSSVSVRFAALSLFNDVHAVPYTNVAMVLIIAYSIYVGAFLILALAYYFYAKRRFRNDEFRRVNKKRYILQAAKNFIGFALVLSAVLFIVARWGLLNSSVVTFNPLDVFVVIFAVAAAIFLGFTIKNLVISFKNARKRRQALRLRLDEDVVDDGTK